MHIVVLLLSYSLPIVISLHTQFLLLSLNFCFGMESFEMKTEKNPSERLTEKGFLIGQAAVRTMSIATTLIAIVLMTTSKQHMLLFSFEIAASYSYSPAFKFCVAANSVACFLSVTSLSVFLYHVRLSNPSQKIYFIMFLLDLVVMLCVISGSSAATAIGYLGQYGNSHAGWMPICDHFGKFCNRIKASLILTYLSALLFTVLTVWTTLKAIKLQFSSSISETDDDQHNLKIRKENKIGQGFSSL